MPMVPAPKLSLDKLNSDQKSENSSINKNKDLNEQKNINEIFQTMKSDNTAINQMDIHTREKNHLGQKGLKINRFFTEKGQDPYKNIKFEKRISKIVNPDGTVVFEMKDVEVPTNWSQVATDILAQKYFRKKGLPQIEKETSIKQVAHRLAGTWRHWGEKYNYFETQEDAKAFEEEVKYMIVDQIAVPNSPQWFNTGLEWAYNIKGKPQGHYYVDPDTKKLTKSEDAYTRPQPHACFIQSVKDDLVNEGGIFELLIKEARLFKYGSGTGTNFSKIRGKGEPLSGGGQSSGLMSFLKVIDRGAGAIKSGGTTRRAAKMVILNADHPEIEKFIDWKVKEEQKVVDLVTGSHINHKYLLKIMKLAEEKGLDPEKNKELKKEIIKAKQLNIPLNYIKRVLMLVENNFSSKNFTIEKYDTDFRSEAYETVSGQNSNNSVRVTNKFMEKINTSENWDLINRTNKKVHKTIKIKDLWEKIKFAAWSCADPGLQFHSTINEWHTCINDGEIIGSNPCSEYMFLDETACNLYQINLLKFYDQKKEKFDTEMFKHVVRLSTIILEISVLMSQLPSKTMAEGTYKYRTLGLGYANLGTLLMQMGYPYDSEEGCAINSTVTAIMGGEAYATSAELASKLGTFERYNNNKNTMLKVIRNHRRAIYNSNNNDYEDLTIFPKKIALEKIDKNLVDVAQESWDYALSLGEKYGYRNAHVTCLAPTGTTGLVMDCDTTGIEPDFALVKFKKLVGGGYFKIINKSIEPALKKLGYPEDQIKAIKEYIIGTQLLKSAPYINRQSLKEKGFTDNKISSIEAVLPTVFELKYAFNKHILGKDFIINTLNIDNEKLNKPEFDLLQEIGFTKEQIDQANEYICGTMMIEGAPYLKKEHYAIFDTANKNGKKGERFINYLGHIKQMAAAQPFLSGAISKTINLPKEATIKDIEKTYKKSWEMMLKATALYRDGSKLSQPLSTSVDENTVYAKLFDFNEQFLEKDINPQTIQKVIYKQVEKPFRRRLSEERKSITHRFNIAGHKGYITVGLFDDNTPGEVFITMNKDGSTLSGILDALARSISWNLQYGMPIETIIKKFSHVRFEPSGMTKNPEIPVAKSIVDYISKWFALKFLDKEKAKKYHNEELVEKSYREGGSNDLHLSFIKFQSNGIDQNESEFNKQDKNIEQGQKICFCKRTN